MTLHFDRTSLTRSAFIAERVDANTFSLGLILYRGSPDISPSSLVEIFSYFPIFRVTKYVISLNLHLAYLAKTIEPLNCTGLTMY